MQVSLALPGSAYAPLQWFATMCMLVDHVGKMLPGALVPGLGWLGRLAFPIFGFVLAAKLARNAPVSQLLCTRIVKRLLLAGACATPFSILAFHSPHGWWPLNCLFLYAVFVAMVYILDSHPGRRFHAIVLFVIGDAFVEYYWCGLLYCLAAWWFCSKNDLASLLAWSAATALLAVPNGSSWGLIAVPVILASRLVRCAPMKVRYFFYVFYPIHLTALVMLRWLCAK